MGVSHNKGYFLGVRIIKDCCTLGSPILGNYHGFSGLEYKVQGLGRTIRKQNGK